MRGYKEVELYAAIDKELIERVVELYAKES